MPRTRSQRSRKGSARRPVLRRSLAATALASIVMAGLVAATVPSTVAPTVAAWNDTEWDQATIGTDSFACGTDKNYTSSASGRFLSGSLVGTDLDTVAGVAGVSATKSGLTNAAVTPTTALRLGTQTTDVETFGNPLLVSALQGVAGIDLTGMIQLGLPLGSAGALNQYAQVTSTGKSAGASGLVSNSGAMDVTSGAPSNALPEPATISLARLLSKDISAVDLRVGAVAASSQLDWCAQLENQLWGDKTMTEAVRDYNIASLDLRVQSPLVSDLVGSVSSTVTGLEDALAALVRMDGPLAGTIRSTVGASSLLTVPLMGTLVPGTITGQVTVGNVDLTTVKQLLSSPLTDGTVTIDLATGTVTMNLATLLGDTAKGIKDLDPNTELVLNARVVNELNARVGTLLDSWTSRVVVALTAAEQAVLAAPVTVATSINLTLLGSDVAALDIRLRNTDPTDVSPMTVRDVINGTAALQVTSRVVGSQILGGLLAGVAALAAGVTTDLVAPTKALLSTSLVTPVTTLGSGLAAATLPVVTALAGVVNSLPSIVSLRVNVQPDKPKAPAGPSFVSATGQSSAEYRVSALRVGLLDGLGAPVAAVYLATATSGVNTRVR